MINMKRGLVLSFVFVLLTISIVSAGFFGDLFKPSGKVLEEQQDVSVTIGQFFYNPSMVITGVNFQFSKQMTKAGPLFVNATIDLSTRKILTDLEDVGLILPSGAHKRYKETGGAAA